METVKGVKRGYMIGGDTTIDIPIDDIEKFIITHETGRNGLLIKAMIKQELVSFVSVGHPEADKYGEIKRKYPKDCSKIHIRIKDNPRFRKKLFDLLMKQETKEQKIGINAGTPAAIMWTLRWKEVTPNEVFQ